jgi:hypothetical protein
MQLLLTTTRHFIIALCMPVRLSATTPTSLHGRGGPPLSWRALNLMEAIFSTYDKCTLSAITQKLNVSGHTLIWLLFLALVCENLAQNLSASFKYILYILRLGIFYFLLFYGTTPINSDYNV